MHFFFEQLVSGLTVGAIYALLGLGFALMFGVLKVLNLAHGDVYMVGAFIGFYVLTSLGGPANLSVPVPIVVLLMLLAAGTGSGLLGLSIERFAFRPLREAPRTSALIASLGISFVLEYIVLLIFTANVRSYSASDFVPFSSGVQIGSLKIWTMRIFVLVLAVLLMFVLRALVERTRLGKAVRAVAFDREAAAMMGIDVDRTIATTFFISSAVAGIAGVMFGLLFSQVWFQMGFVASLMGLTASVVGGIGNMTGAMVGGLLIGLAEAFTTGYISATYQNLMVFGILIVFMLVRPNGLLGRPAVQKV
jgi:branched-chain amino acid transport system permease protein